MASCSTADEGLVRYTKDFGVEPCLATSWQQISPTQWRFTLRKNVKFHDGTPFTADDVVFSYGRIIQPQGTNQIYVSGVKEVKKVDDHTVDMMLGGPNPVLLRLLVDFRIMSKSWAMKNKSENVQNYVAKEESYASRNANGTGPYLIKLWEPDKRILFAANTAWWDKISGNATEVIYTPIKADATRVAAPALRRRRPGHRPADAGRGAPAHRSEAQGARRATSAHDLHRHGPVQRRAGAVREREEDRSRTCA